MIAYVVIGSEGSYSDYSEWNIQGYRYSSDAKARIELEQANDELYNSIIDAAYSQFRLDWFLRNPMPKSEHLCQLETPFPNGLDKNSSAAKTLKATNDRIRKANENGYKRHREAQNKWEISAQAACLEILRNLNVPEEKFELFDIPLWNRSPRERHYEIEELEIT